MLDSGHHGSDSSTSSTQLPSPVKPPAADSLQARLDAMPRKRASGEAEGLGATAGTRRGSYGEGRKWRRASTSGGGSSQQPVGPRSDGRRASKARDSSVHASESSARGEGHTGGQKGTGRQAGRSHMRRAPAVSVVDVRWPRVGRGRGAGTETVAAPPVWRVRHVGAERAREARGLRGRGAVQAEPGQDPLPLQARAPHPSRVRTHLTGQALHAGRSVGLSVIDSAGSPKQRLYGC